jgi:hypothetical protein
MKQTNKSQSNTLWAESYLGHKSSPAYRTNWLFFDKEYFLHSRVRLVRRDSRENILKS